MKIQPATLEALRAAVAEVLEAAPRAAAEYKRLGMSHERFRWDVLHAANVGTRIEARLYAEGLNDSHIDTALRAVVPTFPA